MKDVIKKVAVGLTTGGLLVHLLSVPALGAITVNVSGNGSSSNNSVNVTQDVTTVVTQTNNATVNNTVNTTADTGNNSANRNTGGTTSVITGNATANATVTNDVNNNSAQVGCNSCPTDVTANITNNGSSSTNGVTLGLTNTTFVTQNNTANVTNDVNTRAATGDNTADDNTGGSTTIHTGGANGSADVLNTVNGNDVTQVNSGNGGGLALTISGNGSLSANTLDLDLSSTLVFDQANTAAVANTVGVDATTGDNDASRNTGGTVSVMTGAATAGATVDNAVNFNTAEVTDCCELDGSVNIANNGSSAVNDVSLDLASIVDPTQANVYAQTNDLTADATTGSNVEDDNTNGNVTTTTGNALNDAVVTSSGNSNVYTN